MREALDLPSVVWVNLGLLCTVMAALGAVPWLLALVADRWLWRSRRPRD